jgi:hypothetical protein
MDELSDRMEARDRAHLALFEQRRKEREAANEAADRATEARARSKQKSAVSLREQS